MLKHIKHIYIEVLVMYIVNDVLKLVVHTDFS